jgi:hypothetical protein
VADRPRSGFHQSQKGKPVRKILGIAAIVGLGLSFSVPNITLSQVHAASGSVVHGTKGSVKSAQAVFYNAVTMSAACGLLVTHRSNGSTQFVPFQCSNATLQTVPDCSAADSSVCADTGPDATTYDCVTGDTFAPGDPGQGVSGPTSDYPGWYYYAANAHGSFTPPNYFVDTYTFNNVPSDQCLFLNVNWAGFYDSVYWSNICQPISNAPFYACYVQTRPQTIPSWINVTSFSQCYSTVSGPGFFWPFGQGYEDLGGSGGATVDCTEAITVP